MTAHPLARLRHERPKIRTTDICLPKHYVCELPHLAGSRRVTTAFAVAGGARFGPRSACSGDRGGSRHPDCRFGGSPRERRERCRLGVLRATVPLAPLSPDATPCPPAAGPSGARPRSLPPGPREEAGLAATRSAFRRWGPFRLLAAAAFAAPTSGRSAHRAIRPRHRCCRRRRALVSRADDESTPMQASERAASLPSRPLRTHPFARSSSVRRRQAPSGITAALARSGSHRRASGQCFVGSGASH